jgi:hypothetical protein
MAATNRPDFKDFQSFRRNNFDRRLLGSSTKKLDAIANRMLAKSGFFDRTIYPESFGIDADMISGRSSLRPNWHGRA